jgi:16S rRNA (cytidine1402-2'-O)-methyltransferase
MSGTLHVVATPIGNLEDITLRALRVLREAGVIAAEDTRRTGKLLAHYGISTRMLSFHEHNSRTRVPQLLERLRVGDTVALVSDAGTPGISDPGLDLIRACVAAEIPIDPVPGASAVLTALVAAGFPMDAVVFLGFPPSRSNSRKRWVARVASNPNTVVFFESPHRIVATLTEFSQCSGERPIMLARELTKLHQEFIRGTTRSLLPLATMPKGEFTVVLGPPALSVADNNSGVQPINWADELGLLTVNGALSRRKAIATLAKRYGLRSNEVYAFLEQAKVSGK